ncbi:MAG TPA: hypothetical protein VFU69_10145, partial [Ktedonobacterales bacterium]|nr:hypothetical protein [Ktedonobacterales bacterium]
LLRLMTNANLRAELSANAGRYLQQVVSWDVVAEQYLDAYAMAAAKMRYTPADKTASEVAQPARTTVQSS